MGIVMQQQERHGDLALSHAHPSHRCRQAGSAQLSESGYNLCSARDSAGRSASSEGSLEQQRALSRKFVLNIEDTFQYADLFVNASDAARSRDQVKRSVELKPLSNRRV